MGQRYRVRKRKDGKANGLATPKKKNGKLTPREAEVLELRNQEYTSTIENIAEMWKCSPSTVSKTIGSLKKKIIRLL
ncbi:MAG: sigma-70 family RNA polymerase sigma factor [Eubacterium sp.]|nr:sigma-70 family RNA polymerase sigma factor [Eubacterium sp.]MCI9209421.1 sigma-70 family RNA polymerase sigma factor [Eubacterium sp.]